MKHRSVLAMSLLILILMVFGNGCDDSSQSTNDVDSGTDGDTDTDTDSDTDTDADTDTDSDTDVDTDGGEAAWKKDCNIDQVMLYDWRQVTRVKTTEGWAWMPTSIRSASSVFFSSPEDDSEYSQISDTTLLYQGDGVGAYGLQGVCSEYHFTSGTQDVTVSWDDMAGFGYVDIGLKTDLGVAAFNEDDTLAFDTKGVVTSASVRAPPPLNPDTFLGTPAGFDTTINLTDGTFDLVIVRLLLKGGTQGEKLIRFIRPDDMTLTDTTRSAPVMDAEALSAAAALGLTPHEPTGPMKSNTLIITVVGEKMVDGIGPEGRSEPVYAGHQWIIEKPVIEFNKQ